MTDSLDDVNWRRNAVYEGFNAKLKRVLDCIQKNEHPCMFRTWIEHGESLENDAVCDYVRKLGFRCDKVERYGPENYFGLYCGQRIFQDTVFDVGHARDA